ALAEVSIYDRSAGAMLPTFRSDGRWYVVGRTGDEYEVHIRNNTAADLLAVVSVDGVNVVSGETASPGQSGYVIGAWQSLDIRGWRKSLARIAAFYFTDRSDAYATRTGRPDEVGVIGVALFRRKAQAPAELEQPQPRIEPRSDDQLRQPAPAQRRGEAPAAAQNAAPDFSVEGAPAPGAAIEPGIGTGHGRSEASHARYVGFERESDLPNEIVELRYDSRANLVARGIIPPRPRDPNPFPARFVPDPPR
ncbi:MAG TPA: hypothetical protein VEH49_06750, partial [Methylomirabilota bacterium]|nr:hypothetical protein [Methylomirabilota bacterium]